MCSAWTSAAQGPPFFPYLYCSHCVPSSVCSGHATALRFGPANPLVSVRSVLILYTRCTHPTPHPSALPFLAVLVSSTFSKVQASVYDGSLAPRPSVVPLPTVRSIPPPLPSARPRRCSLPYARFYILLPYRLPLSFCHFPMPISRLYPMSVSLVFYPFRLSR